ncbi:MAG TPA: glycosyltransferase family 4 protein [Pyrinomonadaceae bacterium]|nr:glycosyltransferase family 4 protein [Pyrinomonadaceae bacterium]
MKVLFYNHTGQVSGAERVLLMILARLDRDAFETLVICPESGPLTEMVSELGVPVENIPALQARFTSKVFDLFGYFKSFLAVMRQLRRRVAQFKPDVLHANSIRGGLVATTATLGLRTRVVWHLHDLLPQHPLSSLIRVFASLSLRTSMIAVSQAVEKNFRGKLSWLLRDRVKVILNAIDTEAFVPGTTAKRSLQRELRLRESDLLLGIVGQITKRKGQLELVRAFAKVHARIPNSVLLIVGAPLFNRDYEYLDLLKQTISELGLATNVRVLGARSDVSAIMQSLDLLVVNSAAEPFGLVIPEAMACGTPVLATAVDGIPEIIVHGESGWLVQPNDESEMANQIVHLCLREELRERITERATEVVNTNFSLRRYLTELQTFYKSQARVRARDVKVGAPDRQAEAA